MKRTTDERRRFNYLKYRATRSIERDTGLPHLEAHIRWYETIYRVSEHWQHTRLLAIIRADYRCERCGISGEPLEVHHCNYDNLGFETEADITALCGACHEAVHEA